MIDALVLTLAAVAVVAAVCSIALGVWMTARAAWIERRRKQGHGGYLDFTPTRPTRRSRRGSHHPGP